MKNFPVIHEGKEYWISRAIAVVVRVFAIDKNHNTYILAVQRGKGTPDPEFVGSWCLPCGYLDYDETTKEAAARELFEETGLKFKPNKLDFHHIKDDPKSDKRQNVSLVYDLYPNKYIEEMSLINKFSEKNEVSDVRWILFSEIDNYNWAFNHNKVVYGL